MIEKRKLVVVITRGHDDERASVAWSIANGGINAGLDVKVFLASSGVDWVRKGAYDNAHPNPEDPTIEQMILKVMESGCEICVCPPCAKVRGYSEKDMIEGVKVVGSIAIHEPLKEGAAVMTF